MDNVAAWRIAKWLTQTTKLMADKSGTAVVTPVHQSSEPVLIATVDKSDVGKVVKKTDRTLVERLTGSEIFSGARVHFCLHYGGAEENLAST